MCEKKLNLYLYIPPNSAHPPGVVTDTIHPESSPALSLGTYYPPALLWLSKFLVVFFQRLPACNCTPAPEFLLPLFTKANNNAKAYLARSEVEHTAYKKAKTIEAKHRVFLHLPFHPSDSSSSMVEDLWQIHVIMLPIGNKRLFKWLINDRHAHSTIDCPTIAYRQAPNLGNVFSLRNFQKQLGPPVSSFWNG